MSEIVITQFIASLHSFNDVRLFIKGENYKAHVKGIYQSVLSLIPSNPRSPTQISSVNDELKYTVCGV